MKENPPGFILSLSILDKHQDQISENKKENISYSLNF